MGNIGKCILVQATVNAKTTLGEHGREERRAHGVAPAEEIYWYKGKGGGGRGWPPHRGLSTMLWIYFFLLKPMVANESLK